MTNTMPPKKIALLTDSCSDLSRDTAAKNGIFIVPLRILCPDGEYIDGVDIKSRDIYKRQEEGETLKTSLPLAGDVEQVLDDIKAAGYDGVIGIMLSSGLSGTYNLVSRVAEEYEGLTAVIFDSLSGSLGAGIILMQLAEDIRKGMDWDTLTERRVPHLIRNTFAFFSVDTLEHLQKGGRIGKVTAIAGTLLNIKPVITFADDGQLKSVAKVRGKTLVMAKLVECVAAHHEKGKKYNLAIANGGAPEDVKLLEKKLVSTLHHANHLWAGEIGGTLSAYIGKGVLGCAIQLLD